MPRLTLLRDALRRASYDRQALHALGAFRGAPIDREQAISSTADGSSLSVLTRLFFLRVPVVESLAAAALAPADVTQLIDEGLIERMVTDAPAGAGVAAVPGGDDAIGEKSGGGRGPCLVGACAIVPIGNLLILRDFEPNETGQPLRPDHVLGVGKATSILSALTVRKQVDRVLDIGTGQGFQALVAASSHAKQVIATDVTDRSLRFARWACGLNDIHNITFRKGGLFEPVEGELPFDLIVSNPPFIIAPPHDLVCLGGEYLGDSLVQRIVEGVPQRLTDGGYACITCNWHHPGPNAAGEETWMSRPRSWIPAGAHCDAWLIEVRRESAADYVDGWMTEAHFDSRGEHAVTAGQWRKYLTSLGAAYISLGCIIIRKRSGGITAGGIPTPLHWFRADSLSMEQCDGEASDQIQRIFENQSILSNISKQSELADLPLGLAPAHELTQTRAGTGGRGWSTSRSILKQTQGFEFEVAVDNHAADLLGFFDGITPCREIISVMAKRLKVDPEHAVNVSGPFLARMMALGHLTVGDVNRTAQ